LFGVLDSESEAPVIASSSSDEPTEEMQFSEEKEESLYESISSGLKV
jgi:hypothetical protein